MLVKAKELKKISYRRSHRGKTTMLNGFDTHLFIPSVNILRNASHQYSIPQAKRFIYKTITHNDTLYFPDQSFTLKAPRVCHSLANIIWVWEQIDDGEIRVQQYSVLPEVYILSPQVHA